MLYDSDLNTMALPPIRPQKPRIVMTSSERPPISGLVEITVMYDETRPRGISVQVSGAMMADLKQDVLEEVCQCGGMLGLSGKVWSSARSSP